MKIVIRLPEAMKKTLYSHLFQNEVEQGAFLFARLIESDASITLDVFDQYLIPEEGWTHQSAYHLELKDSERAKIMKLARDQGAAIVDCHSHVGYCSKLNFSLSDIAGIEEFSGYVKWKLNGKPYCALVFNEVSIDAVAWYGNFEKPVRVNEILIGPHPEVLVPLMTWFNQGDEKKKGKRHGR